MESYLRDLFSVTLKSYINKNDINGNYEKHLIKAEDITSTRFADFQFNGLLRLFQSVKQKQTTIALKNVFDELNNLITLADTPAKVISKLELSKNFVNITINDKFLYDCFIATGHSLLHNGFVPMNLLETYNKYYKLTSNIPNPPESKQNIIVDYSSPNVAKSLHIGHLRSTIIGESIVRLLKTVGHNVVGLNHIGDWGTQFGMIISYLKTIHASDQKEIMENAIINELNTSDSNHLMEIYRNSKKLFDEKDTKFADTSREQTFLLQQGDLFNNTVWKKICEISSKEYSNLYDLLNVRNLTERGESFYQNIISSVIDSLTVAGLVIEKNNAKIIMLDNWTYPLMIVKSDGGYTYDTTDLAALYHRLVILKANHIIYITDSGQKSHFDMCFEIAEKMGWTKTENSNRVLTHIGFGLVCGADGKKLKTRSGDVVKMLDVITEVIQRSEQIVRNRAWLAQQHDSECIGTTTASYYHNIDEKSIKDMSRKIGINTLKYFDLSHNHESNYKYDPDLMFRFTGDTGVYLMYCFARINGIIEKSSLPIKRNNQNQDHVLTSTLFNSLTITPNYNISKETRLLLLHILNLNHNLTEAIKYLDINRLVKYLFTLCTYFNGFITQLNGKIIGSDNENFGIAVCLVTSKIIESIFDILSFEEVQHI